MNLGHVDLLGLRDEKDAERASEFATQFLGRARDAPAGPAMQRRTTPKMSFLCNSDTISRMSPGSVRSVS